MGYPVKLFSIFFVFALFAVGTMFSLYTVVIRIRQFFIAVIGVCELNKLNLIELMLTD